MEGRILGVNTSKLFGDSQGVAFARPIGLASELIGISKDRPAAFALDLSTPERAVLSCARAWELGSKLVVECMDPKPVYELVLAANDAELARNEPTLTAAERQRKVRANALDEVTFTNHFRETMVHMAQGASIADEFHREDEYHRGTTDWTPEEKKKASERLERDFKHYAGGISESTFRRTGMKIDPERRGDFRQILKMGLRIEATREVAADRAWVHVAGRNLDGTSYQRSQYLMRTEGGWRENGYPKSEDMKTLPPGFPPPILDFDEGLRAMIEPRGKPVKGPHRTGP
jgi:hypothetical protein